MEGRVVMECAIIGFFGLLSVVLGFAAEATRIKPDQGSVDIFFSCSYPKSPATGLGTLALLAIIISEIFTSVATGCICCCKRGPQPTSRNWIAAQVCFVLSWITATVAVILLMTASIENSGEDANITCTVADPGDFASGAVLSFVTVVLGLVSYILSLVKNSNNPKQEGIAMAQPQHAEANLYQGATPIGQPQNQSGNPLVPNEGGIPTGQT